jgi:hypothetical protein
VVTRILRFEPDVGMKSRWCSEATAGEHLKDPGPLWTVPAYLVSGFLLMAEPSSSEAPQLDPRTLDVRTS